MLYQYSFTVIYHDVEQITKFRQGNHNKFRHIFRARNSRLQTHKMRVEIQVCELKI